MRVGCVKCVLCVECEDVVGGMMIRWRLLVLCAGLCSEVLGRCCSGGRLEWGRVVRMAIGGIRLFGFVCSHGISMCDVGRIGPA